MRGSGSREGVRTCACAALIVRTDTKAAAQKTNNHDGLYRLLLLGGDQKRAATTIGCDDTVVTGEPLY